MKAITWFKHSPSAGDPSCLCSWCEAPIAEDEAPILRLWSTANNTEARFHLRCAAAAGVISAPPIRDTFADFDDGDVQ